MDKIIENGKLEVGILVDGVVHRDFTLRAAILADSYTAVQSVPVPDGVDEDKALRIAYQMAIEDAQILCQLESLGTLDPVPLPQALVSELDPDDMAILRAAAGRVKKKLLDSRMPSEGSAAPSSSSSDQVSG